jgi:hypothetical protein
LAAAILPLAALLWACSPALIKVQAPPRCAAVVAPPPELPPKPRLPEVAAAAGKCPYALCLDSANYARLLERLRLLEQDDNQVRELYSAALAASPTPGAGAGAP